MVIMLRYLLVFSLIIFSTSIQAIEVEDLYIANVAVDSQSNKERAQALKKAMKIVLVKVGGEEEILDNEIMKNAIVNYKGYFSTYRYRKIKKQNNLIVTFDEKKINQLFIEAELPLWGSLRPQTLVWVVKEDGLSRQVISSSALTTIPNQINDFSSLRGLPMILPLMDLTDSMSVSMTDLWGRFTNPIKEVSSRYAPEMIAVVRISNSSLLPVVIEYEACEPLCDIENSSAQNLVVDWQLISDSRVISSNQQLLDYQGDNLELLLGGALADITQNVYEFYALTSDGDQEFVIDIGNVDSLVTYERVNQYLSGLSSVSGVKLKQANGELRRYSLELLGSKQAFLASLKLDNSLKQFIDPLADIDPNAVPVFFWNK